MKQLLRFFLVGLAFSATCLFAQAATNTTTAAPQSHYKSENVAKKSHKKQKKHRKAQ